MNFKQFLKLNEMYVKENGKEYFLIPATIDNIKKCKTIKDVIKTEYIYIRILWVFLPYARSLS